MPRAEIAGIAVRRDDDRIGPDRMLACFDAEPGRGAGDPAGADVAEQPDPGGGGDAKHAMMQFRRMYGAAAIKQHAAMIECCIHMLAGPFRRHHAGA